MKIVKRNDVSVRLCVGVGSLEALELDDSDGFMNVYISVLHLDTPYSNWATLPCMSRNEIRSTRIRFN